jgi:hypothetical protein
MYDFNFFVIYGLREAARVVGTEIHFGTSDQPVVW